jgi:hypothetical protein
LLLVLNWNWCHQLHFQELIGNKLTDPSMRLSIGCLTQVGQLGS